VGKNKKVGKNPTASWTLTHIFILLNVTIWKLGRTVCVYSMVQRREKEKDSRYIQEASAPAAVTVYQTCNIMYICNTQNWTV